MLGKLVKDECKSYGLYMGIVFLAGLLFTVFLKVICMLPYEKDSQVVIQFLSMVVYFLVFAVMNIAIQVLIVIRFYSTMIGDRGYLTWTLPASSAELIWSKLIGSIIWRIIMAIGMLLLIIVFFAGNYWMWLGDFTDALHNGSETDIIGMIIQSLLKGIKENFEIRDAVFIVLELISVFIWSIAGSLLIYMCMAIGQLFGKWRIIASIGSYFAIIIIIQILSVIWIAISARIDMAFIAKWFSESMFGSVIGMILFGLAACGVLFIITNNLFKKHLNLE